jgi:hypothetical protein
MNNEINNKLNSFIRKYYKNLLIKGLVYSILLLLVFFLVLNLIEYFGYNAPIIRTIIFYAYLLLALTIFCLLVVKPLFKIFSIGKTLSYKQAAKIIGNHFPEIQDKLLNLLQLQDISSNSNSELLKAAITQKTLLLSPIPFTKAIDTTKTKKYAKVLLMVLCLIILIGVFFPKILSEPTFRYLNHNTFYEKPAPFAFYVKDAPLRAIQQADITINVEVKGEMLPDKADIIVDGQEFEMKQRDKTHFSYTIHQIQKTTQIQFSAMDVKSKIYVVEVNPKPILTDVRADIIYPAYTKIKNETVSNVTNLSLPKGTTVRWHIQTKDTKSVIFKSSSSISILSPEKNGNIEFLRRYLSNQDISIKTKNNFTLSTDSINFSISIIEDEAPQIAVIEEKDSVVVDKIYFRGQIKDDYGFNKLEFHLSISKGDKGEKGTNIAKNITITKNENAQEFYYYVDLAQYDIKAGDKVNYYFQVWDNDQVNGSKSAKSQVFTVSLPTEKEMDKKIDDNSKEIKKEADNAIDEIKKLQRQINDLSKRLVDKKEISWQDEKEIKELMQKQEQIKQRVNQIQKNLEENSKIENNMSSQDKELMQKEEEIQKLFNDLQNNDLKELMQKLQEMTQKNFDKEKVNESLKDIKNKNEELSKQLDKNLEMYKRLEVEKDINNVVEKLNELSKKQEELSNQTKNNSLNKEELNKRQQQLNKEFNDLKQKMSEIKQKDSQLETPFNFNKDTKKENSISEKQNQAQKDIQKGKNKDASNNQKGASQQMKEMANSIEKEQEENQEEQLGEDINNVRQILKNLVTLSKKQENLIYQTQSTSVSNPNYQKIINEQNNIKEAMKSVGDSLYAISKRQSQVSNTINQEMSKVKSNVDNSLSSLLRFNQSLYSSYKNNQATSSQQYAMASMNNLSLLLAESLDNMNKQKQQSQKNKGKASKQCNNPSSSGQGKSSPKTMRELQEALNKEIQRLQQELSKRGNPAHHKIGEDAKMNEELAKAAAQQEMIRQMMQDYLNELKQENAQGVGGNNKALKQMEDTEKDIVNKRINNQTIQRQNEILTRMLESERAEKKKGRDNERKSTVGVDVIQKNNQNIEAFNKLKNRELELFRKIPPIYSSYYKAKVNEYFYNFETQNKKH